MASVSPASLSPSGALSHPGVAELTKVMTSAATAGKVESPTSQWFKTEVQPLEPKLRGWLEHHHPSLKGELDDIVQESYFRLIRAYEAGTIRCLRTYLYGIARHVALGLHRDQRNISFHTVNELPETATISPDGDTVKIVSRRSDLAVTAEAIQTLPDRCREIVLLHTVEGLSYQAIAKKLDLAEETIRVQMARAVKKCIQFLREREGGTP